MNQESDITQAAKSAVLASAKAFGIHPSRLLEGRVDGTAKKALDTAIRMTRYDTLAKPRDIAEVFGKSRSTVAKILASIPSAEQIAALAVVNRMRRCPVKPPATP